MILPLEWLSEYVKVNKKPKEIADSFTVLGLMQEKAIKNDILEVEHRMDRADWLSIIGCARDLAAMEDVKLQYPTLHNEKGAELPKDQKIKIEVQCPELVHRFNTRIFKNIKVKESPDWLKKRLAAYGIPAINNVVDITNYVMIELGQPLHAQDINKMETREIVIRKARDGETMTTLLGETVKLDNDVFVLTQNNKPTVIGGIVGGDSTGVDKTTTEIILDSGSYDQTNIRKSSRNLKILNETVMRYDKFLHPYANTLAIQRATHLILELAGGEYYENEDYYPNPWKFNQKKLRLSRVKQISGLDFKMPRVKEILTALEYKILEETSDELVTEIPYFRTDIQVEDDLVADILRINNYNNIPISPIASAPPIEITPEIYKFEEKLRNILISLGAHEHITVPLVAKDVNNDKQVKLENALTTDKSALRTSIYETLMDVAKTYRKHKIFDAVVFEIGKIYEMKGNPSKYESYDETRTLEIIDTGKKEANAIATSNNLKQLLAAILASLGIERVSYKPTDSNAHIYKEDIHIGILKIDSITLLIENLLKTTAQDNRATYTLTNKVTEDIAVVIDTDIPFGPIYEELANFDESIIGVSVLEEYMDEERLGKDKKSILVRLAVNAEKTSAKQILKLKESILELITKVEHHT